MAVTDTYVSVPNWSYNRQQANEAYQRALDRLNLQKGQLQNAAGVRGLGNIQDYYSQGGTTPNFDIDPNAQYGSYQKMRQAGGQRIQGIADSFDTSWGTTGYQGELERQERVGQEGEYQGFKQGLLDQMSNMILEGRQNLQQRDTTLTGIDLEEGAYNAWRQANMPVVTPTDGTTPPAPGPGAGNPGQVTPRQAQDAEAAIRRANQTGDTAALAALFKNTALPENLRRMADQFLTAWRLKRQAAPIPSPKAPPNVKPDPHPSSKVKPDPAPKRR